MTAKENDANVKNIKLNWEEHYKATPMKKLHWYAEAADEEVLEAMETFCLPDSDILDLGTGPGTMAIELTKMGYNVTATDISDAAIEMAKQRAGKLIDKIEFINDDITNTKITKKYDIIHDRGCLHVLNESGRKKYIKNVHKLLKENGILLLKTFSINEPRDDGPNKYSIEMIAELFKSHFEILHSEENVYPSTLPIDPIALFCVLRKR